MPASDEKTAVLARRPAGAWNQTTLCPGESETLAVEQRGLHHVAYSLVAVAMAASARRAAE